MVDLWGAAESLYLLELLTMVLILGEKEKKESMILFWRNVQKESEWESEEKLVDESE